jgi:hypothetical protein
MPSRRDGLCCRCHAAPALRSYCRPCGQAQDRAYRALRAQNGAVPVRVPKARPAKPKPPAPVFRPGQRVRVACLPPLEGRVTRTDPRRELVWVDAGEWGEVAFGVREVREPAGAREKEPSL